MTYAPLSYRLTKGDGQTTDFTVPFPYLDRHHVTALVNGVPMFAQWLNSTQIRLEPAPPEGSQVLLRRQTPMDVRLVEFQNASTLHADSLNKSSLQHLYLMQELRDGVMGGIYGDNPDGLPGGNTGSIIDEVTKRITETSLYQELQRAIDLSSLNATSILENIATTSGLREDLSTAQGRLQETRGDLEEAKTTLRDAFEAGDAALDARITVVDSKADTGLARVTAEELARAVADEALAGRLTAVESQQEDNRASILNEEITRATADEALAGRITEVEAKADDSLAKVTTEALTRATADEALSGRIDEVEAKADDSLAKVTTEALTRATADEALSGRITEVEAKADDSLAKVTAEAITRAAADEALSVRLEELSAEINVDDLSEAAIAGFLRENDNLERNRLNAFGNTKLAARITTEEAARANADEVLAGRLTKLETQVGEDLRAAITEERLARIDADAALALRVDTIETQVGDDLQAILQEEREARIDGDAAIAHAVDTLGTVVGENTAAVQTQAQAINGLQAQYVVKVDVNGHVAGYGVAVDGSGTSDFIIRSQNFTVVDPSTGKVKVGWDHTTHQFVVDGDAVINGTIKANALDIAHLSAISTNLGTVTAGTFKTSSMSTGYRVEISDSGSYPMWYGTGAKSAANALFYMDANGNAMYRGKVEIRSATSGARLEILPDVIKVYDSNGALRVKLGNLLA